MIRESRGAKVICVILGAGYLFPWYAVVTAADYFLSLYDRAEFYFALSYNVPLFISMLLLFRFGSGASLAGRIVGGFLVFAVTLGLMPLIPTVVGEGPSTFWVYVALIAAFAVADAVCQGSMFALTGVLGPAYTQAQLLGNGVAAMVISLLRIVTKASVPATREGNRLSARIYFSIACASMVGCIGAFLFLWRMPFTRERLRRSTTAEGILAASLRGTGNLSDRGDIELEEERGDDSEGKGVENEDAGHSDDDNHLLGGTVPLAGADSGGPDDELVPTGLPTARALFAVLWPDALALWSTFVITLALFPGLTAEIKSFADSWALGDWFPVLLISLFAVGDSIGRFAPSWHPVLNHIPIRVVRVAVFLRILLVPVFLLLVKPSPEAPIIRSELVAVLTMLVFAVSNGYLCAQLMMHAPQRVPMAWRQSSGTAMSVALVGGLSSGAMVGFAVSFSM